MRPLGKILLAIGVLGLSAATAIAQGRLVIGSEFDILINKDVQRELKLDDTQAEAVRRRDIEISTRLGKRLQALEEIPLNERVAKQVTIFEEARAEGHRSVQAILNPAQSRRFRQIALQSSGIDAFFRPEIQVGLKLTADQVAKIKDMVSRHNNELRDFSEESFGKGLSREQMLAEGAAMGRKKLAEVLELLDDDQRATWKEMLGKPFILK